MPENSNEENELVLPRNEFEMRSFIKLYAQNTNLTLKLTEIMNEILELQHTTLDRVLEASPTLIDDLREAGIFLKDKKSELGDEFKNLSNKMDENEEAFLDKVEERLLPHLKEIQKFNKGMLTIKIALAIIAGISLFKFSVETILPAIGLG